MGTVQQSNAPSLRQYWEQNCFSFFKPEGEMAKCAEHRQTAPVLLQLSALTHRNKREFKLPFPPRLHSSGSAFGPVPPTLPYNRHIFFFAPGLFSILLHHCGHLATKTVCSFETSEQSTLGVVKTHNTTILRIIMYT
jgi:hypothetical protein